MALHGRAAIAMWCDIESQDCAEHDAWHSQEHLPERLSLPGFLRARRATTLTPGIPRHFVLYEIDTAANLTSPEYLSCLNNPTPWTRKVMTTVRRFNRTPCRVTVSFGAGTGRSLLTLRLSPVIEAEERLRDAICGRLKALTETTGILGAHLLERQAGANKSTNEHNLRGGADDLSDWVVVVEGYRQEKLAQVSDGPLSAAELEAAGAARGSRAAGYELAHIMTAQDLLSSAAQPVGSVVYGNPNVVRSLVR